MRNFILFEGDSKSGKKVKKICRYQQYRAVNKAISRLKSGKDKLSRGGVIWHTQGSGKSLAMVYLAIKIRRDKNYMTQQYLLLQTEMTLINKFIKHF